MKSKLITTGAAILFGLAGAGAAFAQTSTAPGTMKDAAPAQKMSQAECQSMFSKADTGQSGSLTSAQAQPYVTSMSSVDTNADGKLSQAEFMQACNAGAIKGSASTGAATGTGTDAGAGTGGVGTGSGSGPLAPKK